MPYAVTCNSCGNQFKVGEQLLDRKFTGKFLTVRCKRCQQPVRLVAAELRAKRNSKHPVPVQTAPSRPPPPGPGESAGVIAMPRKAGVPRPPVKGAMAIPRPAPLPKLDHDAPPDSLLDLSEAAQSVPPEALSIVPDSMPPDSEPPESDAVPTQRPVAPAEPEDTQRPGEVKLVEAKPQAKPAEAKPALTKKPVVPEAKPAPTKKPVVPEAKPAPTRKPVPEARHVEPKALFDVSDAHSRHDELKTEAAKAAPPGAKAAPHPPTAPRKRKEIDHDEPLRDATEGLPDMPDLRPPDVMMSPPRSVASSSRGATAQPQPQPERARSSFGGILLLVGLASAAGVVLYRYTMRPAPVTNVVPASTAPADPVTLDPIPHAPATAATAEPTATASTAEPAPLPSPAVEAPAPPRVVEASPTPAPRPRSPAVGTPKAPAPTPPASPPLPPSSPKPKVPAAAAGTAFDRAAAAAALKTAADQASACRKANDPSGMASVVVTFAPSGRVTSATISGPPFAGTATGGCIATVMRGARIPPFDGDRTTVGKTVVIR